MDLLMQTNALKIIKQLFDTTQSTHTVIDHVAQKPPFHKSGCSSQPLERCTPEQKGLRSDYIADYVHELFENKTANVHTLTVIKDGAVISQVERFPYQKDVWHITHSLCKSVTGLAIGLLVDDGKIHLDDKLTKFFSTASTMLALPKNRSITIKDALTMSSGVMFNEAGTVTETDWVKSYFESIPRFEPGTQFNYNSMNSYMLSAIVKSVTKQSLSDFLRERLFDKMGIADFFWEKCPMGTEKGGMGMYLLPEDMAKIALLYLNKGVWNGEQLVSKEWCEQATTAQIEVPDFVGTYDYGYQIWVRKSQNWFVMNGMFGQNVLVFPDNNIMVAVTAGNSDNFQENAFFEITERYFGKNFDTEKLPENHAAQRSLQKYETELSQKPKPKRKSFLARLLLKEEAKDYLSRIVGKTFVMDENESPSVGILPLLVQAIQNNYTIGINSIGFDVSGTGQLLASFVENDEEHIIPIGFDKAEYTVLDFHGEKYDVAADADFAENEDGIPVLKLRISFLELPNVRYIKVYFYDNGEIKTSWSETPGKEYLLSGFQLVLKQMPNIKALNSLADNLENTYSLYRMKRAIEPDVWGYIKSEQSN